MLQLDEVKGLDEMMQDAIALKYLTQPLTPLPVARHLISGAFGLMSTIGLPNPSSVGKTTCRRGTAFSSPRKSKRSGPTFVRPSTGERTFL
jgi:hypothetical protein